MLSVIDNTFASPINQQPLALGVDLAMQSATKYLNGHSDVTGGMVAGPAALVAPIEKARRLVGTVMDPHPAYALGRGLKTLPLRVARHNANALAVAEFLAGDRAREPGLLSGAAVASRSRDREAPDDRLRRHGLLRSRTAASTAPSASTTGCRSSSAPPASAASRA